VIQVIVVAECGSELSQIWTDSDGIPNPDLKVSGELSAMCSTEEAVTEPGFPSPARRPYPKSDPAIVHATAGTNSSAHRGVRARGQLSDRRVTSREVCILHQMIEMVRRVGLRRVARGAPDTSVDVDADAEGLQFAVQR
jgi:hypothetical protein